MKIEIEGDSFLAKQLLVQSCHFSKQDLKLDLIPMPPHDLFFNLATKPFIVWIKKHKN